MECVLSHTHIILSYLQNRLSIQMVCALIWVEEWIKAGIINEKQIHSCLKGLKGVYEEDEAEVDDGWDDIDM